MCVKGHERTRLMRWHVTDRGRTVEVSPPKAHLPGKGAPCPSHGEGGSLFKPGRVRGTHASTGGVGVPIMCVMRDSARLVGELAGSYGTGRLPTQAAAVSMSRTAGA